MILTALRANNMSKTLDQLTQEVIAIFTDYEKQGTKPWNYKSALNDLPYQLGSLAKRVNQLEGYRYREGLSDEELNNYIADELADMIAEVLFIAHDMRIDINRAWEKMIESDHQKINQRS